MDTWKYCAKETGVIFKAILKIKALSPQAILAGPCFTAFFVFSLFPSTLEESGRPWSNKMTKSLVQVDIGTFEGAVCIDNFSKHLSALGTSKPNPGLLELR